MVSCAVAKACGGCPLLGIPAAKQVADKLDRVRGAFAALHLDCPLAEGPMVQRDVFAYRNRLRLSVRNGEVAFFNPDKSFDCGVVTPELSDAMTTLRLAISETPSATVIEYLELRTPDALSRPGVYLSFYPAADVGEKEATLRSLRDALPYFVIGTSLCAERATDLLPMPEQRYRIYQQVHAQVPVNAFMQVNASVNEVLVEAVLRVAQETKSQSFLDAYAGCGNFSLPLLAAGLSGHAVETNRHAMRALSRDSRDSLMCHFEAVSDFALAWDHRERVDLVVADPPRAGLREDAKAFAKLRPATIVLICCNADSHARDVRSLTELGFVHERIQCFDMFAQTKHVELMSVLRQG